MLDQEARKRGGQRSGHTRGKQARARAVHATRIAIFSTRDGESLLPHIQALTETLYHLYTHAYDMGYTAGRRSRSRPGIGPTLVTRLPSEAQ
jgi:hypothetical protein